MVATFEPPDGDRSSWEVNTFEVNGECKAAEIDLVMDNLVAQAECEVNERHFLRVVKHEKEALQARLDTRLTCEWGLYPLYFCSTAIA